MDLFKIKGTVEAETAGAVSDLKNVSKTAKETAEDIGDVSSSAEKSSGKWSSFFGKIGSGAIAFGKTVAVGIGTAATAIGGLTVKALASAGELEQNMGGSEAVFKQYATKVQETAKTAFSNMGLSTSDYLATANKMGALFQGAGFDIKESMTLSQDAMQRAADVASIMGIDTASAMEAVAGAAKGNFTMMDNLGVAMNDTAIQNYALSKGIDKTTSEMTQQEKIGLAMEMFMEKTAYAAGNYAKENETLAGSLGTAKAALSNFLSGAGTVEDVVSSFSNFANVVVKNINSMFPSLMNGITQLVNQLVPMIPPLLEQLLPGLISGATSLINGLVAAMPAIVQALLAAVPALIQGVTQIVNSLIAALPALLQTIVAALPTLLPVLINGIVSMIVTLCNNFAQIIQPIIDYLPAIIISIVNALIQNLPALIQGLISLVMGIVSALPQIIQSLVDALPQIVAMIVTALLENLPALIMGFIQLVAGIVQATDQIWGALKEVIPNVFKGIWEGIKNVFAPVGEWFSERFTAAKEAAAQGWSDFKDKMSEKWEATKNVFSNVGSWFSEKFTAAKEAAAQGWSDFKDKMSEKWEATKNVFSNVGSWFSEKFTAAKEASANAFSNLKDKLSPHFEKAKNSISKVADKIKGFFKGEIKMPKIKMPHFSITPSGWKIGDLLEGSIPKLGIDWYAKAMNNPVVMKEPTVFGYNSSTGQLMGGGEAGSEVVSGTNTLMNMIQGAVADQNGSIVYYLNKIAEMLATYLPQILEKLGIPVPAYLGDPDDVADVLAIPMNNALGKLSTRKDRGR